MWAYCEPHPDAGRRPSRRAAAVLLAVIGLSLLSVDAAEGTDGDAIRDAVDAVMAEHLDHGAAGAVVAVVDIEGALFIEGYGMADPANGVPVDPQTTRFPVASVSKAVTATAAVALEHAGELDLTMRVEDATGIDLPGGHGPITLQHLLTHTAGLDEPLLLFPSLPDPVPELGDWLATHPPHASHPPGIGIQYSPSAAYSLVGLAMERATSQTFDDVMAREVFEVVGMEQATFDDAVPVDADDARLPGYPGGTLPAAPERPAASLRVTAPDMAAWVAAALGGGPLAPEVVEAITDVEIRPPQGVGGHTGVLFEQVRGGARTLEQGSGLGWVALLPDADVGVFVAVSSGDLTGIGTMLEVVEAVARVVGPGEAETDPLDWPGIVPDWTDASWEPVRPTGAFHELSVSGHGLESLLRGFAQSRLTADGDALRWGDRVLQPADDRWCDAQGCVSGRRANDGRTYLLRSDADIAEQQQTLVRASWHRRGEVTLGVAAAALVTGLVAIVAWARREVSHRRTHGPRPTASRLGALWALTTTVAIVNVVAVLATALQAFPSWVETSSPLAILAVVTGWLSVLSGVALGVGVVLTWGRRRRSRRVQAVIGVLVPLAVSAWWLSWLVA